MTSDTDAGRTADTGGTADEGRRADAGPTADAARTNGSGSEPAPDWVFLSFVHRYLHFDEVVGGEHVRPCELFNALAELGADVRVYERHRPDGERRRSGNLTVRPLPLPAHGPLRKLFFWPVLYGVFFVELLRARRRGRRLCLYQTLPWGARDGRRLELVPAYVLFWMAGRVGAATWGALHDLPMEHFEYGRTLDEQSERIDRDRSLARRAADVQMRQVRHAHFVTVVSENMRRDVVERARIAGDHVAVFRSSVNPRQMRDIPAWQPPVGRPWRIGFLGHAADAQLPLLVDAVGQLDTDVQTELVLAGDGTPELGNGAAEVRCFGDVKYDDFPAFAREMDVFVIPYADLPYLRIAWQLKPPMNVASGRPVVMTETAETRHSGLAPYLYLAGSTSVSIARQIDAILRDPAAAKERAEAGRAHLLGEMTWRRTAERLVAHLTEAVR